MKVEIAIDPNALQTLASRVAPVPAASGRKPAAGGAGGRRGGGAPRAPRAPRPAKKTAEDLDAEMSVSLLQRYTANTRRTRPPRLRKCVGSDMNCSFGASDWVLDVSLAWIALLTVTEKITGVTDADCRFSRSGALEQPVLHLTSRYDHMSCQGDTSLIICRITSALKSASQHSSSPVFHSISSTLNE